MSYKQMKLISGEELICEIVAWPDDNNKDDETIIIRNAAELGYHEDIEEAIRYYIFRPFMVYQQDQLLVLNGNNITAIATPHPDILKQYKDHMGMSKNIKLLDKLDDDMKDSDNPNVIKFKPRYH